MADDSLNIIIRAFEPEDLPGFTEMLNMPGVVQGTLQVPFRSLDERKKRNETNNPQVSLVAEVGGVIAGHASLDLASSPRRRHVGDIGIMVREDYHRKGIGEKLMRELIGFADNWLGLRRIELTVFAGNTAAIALYEKLGFTREGLHKDFAFRAGRFEDALTMARVI